jgi:hypothetical protein
MGQHGHDPVDVLVPEGLDVPVEQLALLGTERVLDGLLVDVGLGQLGVGALQGTVHGGLRRLERLGHLARLPAQHVTQDEHGALTRRQVLKRGDEREADAVASRHDRSGVVEVLAHDGVGRRLEPQHLRGLDERLAGLARRST